METDPTIGRRAFLLQQCPLPAPRVKAGQPTHVTCYGEAGPRVILIHGGVQGTDAASATFDRQHALAADGWRIEVVDRPGFGMSPSRGIDDQEADALWIAEMLGDGAHLVGHSWSGAASLLAAARRPKAVRSLTLIEPALHCLLTDVSLPTPSMAALAELKAAADLLVTANTPAEYAMAFARSLSGQKNMPNPAVAALIQKPDDAPRLGCAFLNARFATSDCVIKAARTVATSTFPVLVVTGNWSPLFDEIGAITARLTHGRHAIVRAPNHFIQLENSEGFNAQLTSLLHEAGKT